MITLLYEGIQCAVGYDGYNPLREAHEVTVTIPLEFDLRDCDDLSAQVAELFLHDVIEPALRASYQAMGLPDTIIVHKFVKICVIIKAGAHVQTYKN